MTQITKTDKMAKCTYLVNANLRVAKSRSIFTYLFHFLFCLVLHTHVLWLFPFRLHFWITLSK